MYFPLFPKDLIGEMVNVIIHEGAVKATKYLTDKEVIKATRILFKGKVDNRSKKIEIRLTIGTPNFEERKFIKNCKVAGEPFPVKKIQLKFLKKKK